MDSQHGRWCYIQAFYNDVVLQINLNTGSLLVSTRVLDRGTTMNYSAEVLGETAGLCDDQRWPGLL